MEGQGKAITKRPPHGADTVHPRRTVTTSLTSSPSAAALAAVGGIENNMGDWVTFAPTVDCYIRFDRNADMSAPTAADWLMKADSEHSWWITPDDRYFRVVAATVSGSLKRQLSS